MATAQRRPGLSGVREISRSRMNGLKKYNSKVSFLTRLLSLLANINYHFMHLGEP